ncbi:MAG: BBE domain-containing protein [Actinomycetota bacterium]|nr:BBE domain-containing protein [Actinomycetota bacterium]
MSEDQLLGELPPEAIDAFVEQAGPDSGSPLMSVELRHTGGALGRTGEGDGALSAVPGSFLLYGVGLGLPPEAGEASSAACERLTAAMSPYQTGTLLNFVEQAVRIDQFFDPEIMSRLREVKERYDPDHVIRANHSVV